MELDLPLPGLSLSVSMEVVAVFATLIALLATLLAGAATSAGALVIKLPTAVASASSELCGG